MFSNFKEAYTETNNENDNLWDNEIWTQKQLSKQTQALKMLEADETISELAQNHDYLLPAFLAGIGRNISKPRVLDFGGGLGGSYLQLMSMLPKAFDFEFLIVENKLICQHGKKLFRNYPQIHFMDTLPLGEMFDIIHLGSSFHYIEDWEKMIEDFADMKPTYLIFADLPAAEIETFVTNQNYNGHLIPVRFWNVAEFIQKVEKCGFKLLLKTRFHSNYINAMKSFPDKYRLNYFSQLVFVSV